MHRKHARRIWGILKNSVSWVEFQDRRKTVHFRTRLEALWRVPHVMVCRWKSQNIKNVYLSSYLEETLNSKVIKCFLPELRSHVFRVSGFLCSMYICYEHSMYVSNIRIMGMSQTEWLFCIWLFCWLINWLLSWLVDWLIVLWMVDCLIDWFVG